MRKVVFDVIPPRDSAPRLGVSGVLAMATLPDAEAEWLPADVLGVGALGVGGLGWAHFGADHVVELISAAQALIARVQAAQLAAVEELRGRRGDDRDTGDEVAFAISVSKHAADRQVALAKDLTARFPRVLAAMGRGELDAYKASRIRETALPLGFPS